MTQIETLEAPGVATAPKALVLCNRQSAGCWGVDDVKPAHSQLVHHLSFITFHQSFILHLSSPYHHNLVV
jgi:hypothetical protein